MARFRLLLALSMVTVGCRPGVPTADRPNDRLAARLESLLDSTLAGVPDLPGAMLRVEAPALGFKWSKAVGISDRPTREPLRAEQTLRIASNTKTYVAAAMLRLIEDGRLGWDAPIAPHLLPASVKTLKAGGYDGDKMTVRMLLQHTSGLFDYATIAAGANRLALYGPFFDRILAEPTHRWSRAEQLGLAVDHGKPYGKPGEVYHYSDTGYILLGEMIETITGKPMAAAVRELVDFDRHGIRNTYFETLEPVPAGAPPRAHQYMDSVDTNGFDASVDLYGGGGLVSNLEDMALFYRALVRGQVFKHRETIDSMLVMPPLGRAEGGGGYGMGIGLVEYDGVRCYGHGGFWGTAARHCPDVDLTVTAAVTNNAGRPAMAEMVAAAVRAAAAAVAERK